MLMSQLQNIISRPNAIKYGEKLPSSLSNVNIKDINLILEDKNFSINSPDAKIGDYNCIMYDNSAGLINDNRKDPTICSTNIESKCTLSAFTDKSNNINLIGKAHKTFLDYKQYIGIDGLNITKEIVSCNGENIMMWIYKQSELYEYAIGVPVPKCNSLSMTSTDLVTPIDTIKAICKQPISFVLKNTDNGYKCNILSNTNKNSICDTFVKES